MLIEPIESINKWLVDKYGRGDNNEPRLRVVWSEDQIEKVFTRFSAEGFQLPYPVMREVPKYRQWIQNKYILEMLTVVPEMNQAELCDAKLNYEPLWTFQSISGEALPPKREVIEMIMNQVIEAMTRTPNQKRYIQDERDGNTAEAQEKKIDTMMEAMYGNETSVSDALSMSKAVGYGDNSKFDRRKIVH